MKHFMVRVVSPSYEGWRKVFDSSADQLRANSITGWTVYRDTSNPNAALVHFTADDLNKALSFFQTQAFKDLNTAAKVTDREFCTAEKR